MCGRIHYRYRYKYHKANIFGTGVEILTLEDLLNLKFLAIWFHSRIARNTYDAIRATFEEELHLLTTHRIHRRLCLLSGIAPRVHDCCINSCYAYLGEYKDRTLWPRCNEPLYGQDGSARKTYITFPLDDQLKGRFRYSQSHSLIMYQSARYWKIQNPSPWKFTTFTTASTRQFKSTSISWCQAVKHLNGMKGPNVVSPCHHYKLQGVYYRNTGSITTPSVLPVVYHYPDTAWQAMIPVTYLCNQMTSQKSWIKSIWLPCQEPNNKSLRSTA